MSPAARVVVVGAGPAGMTAALGLAEAGVAAVLVDEGREAGGQVFRAGPGGRDRRGAALRRRVAECAAIDHRAGHAAVTLDADRRLGVLTPAGRLETLVPDAVLLAPGAVELFVPVPGWTLPGVFGVGALQLLWKSAAVLPQGPLVLAGAGPLPLLAAAQLAAAGAEVAAVVDAAARPGPSTLAGLAAAPGLLLRGMGLELALRRRSIPVLRGAAVAAVLGGPEHGAEGVEIVRLDRNWEPAGPVVRRIPARTVGLGFGVRPNPELAAQAGCRLAWDPALGGWHPTTDAAGRTSLPGIYAAGDGAGIGGADLALLAGARAARTIAGDLGLPAPPAARGEALRAARLARFRGALAAWCGVRPGIYRLAGPDTVVCRCEGTTAGEIEAAARLGAGSAAAVKLATRAGMGSCQGRVCAGAVQHLAAAAASLDAGEPAPPSARPPARPVPLSAWLSGCEPER
ncbi:NAD(P)/FAD-dependent oxidoreductase [Arenibaculum sp.]|uniref:NAD(P)/FAD-dependent oxidoreductase n=1 Tax=Arenibaculum sp. TaxID=2865862 RepID=UPI002E13FC60|nr:NAD(P)/FAD-dependent oxidoreductase [Arenibaculum sp.]